MKTQWTQELTPTYPAQFEQIDSTTYLQRKDVEVHKLEDGTEDGYTCMSRKISDDVYEALQEEYASPTYQAMIAQKAVVDAVEGATAEILITLMEG